MKIQKVAIWLLLNVVLFCEFPGSAQTITVFPKEYKPGLNNPLKEFRQGIMRSESGYGKWKNLEYNSIWRHYIAWSDIESNVEDGVQKIIYFCNKSWKGAEAANVRITPRVYIDWDNNPGNEFWPTDILTQTGLQPNDPKLWEQPIVKERIVKLIDKLRQAWDNDERVAWIQTGILGYWGEQENRVGVDTDGWAKRLGDAYTAFKNKKLIVRNQPHWDAQGYKWGVYWDSYAHPSQKNGAWSRIQNTNATGRYLSEIIEGEVAYNWGEDSPAHTLDGVIFDNPKTNDTRYYASLPNYETYSATLVPPVNGLISIPDGPYPANSNLIVTANPDSGFVFSSWDGDLTGAPNPAILTMDGNKKKSANFKRIIYTLTENAANGSSIIDPAGGTYNSGALVNIAAVPDSGYVFDVWSSNYTGVQNPATIMMNQNKTITALFRQIVSGINDFSVLPRKNQARANYPQPFFNRNNNPS